LGQVCFKNKIRNISCQDIKKYKGKYMKILNWVIAHEPYNLFIRAAAQFSENIENATGGKYKINVMTLSQWNAQSSEIITTHASDRAKVVGLVNNGTIDMATVYVNTLGNVDNNLWSLSMPFLFDGHDHAESVLDGKIGQELLAGLSTKSNLKGLAFTYSGGFRIVPGKKAIETVKDFYNLVVRTSSNPVALDTFTAVGAKPVSILIDDFRNAMNEQVVTAGETTYPRFFTMGHNEQAKFINHTEHSLFLTGVVTNSKVWNEMDADTQQIFADAAIAAAKLERQDSLADIQVVQGRARASGIETVTMSNTERAKFAATTESLYAKYDTIFTSGLLDSIRKAK
jgi:TRAP-type C4-dicarboxylate transport system substrate-binding protein